MKPSYLLCPLALGLAAPAPEPSNESRKMIGGPVHERISPVSELTPGTTQIVHVPWLAKTLPPFLRPWWMYSKMQGKIFDEEQVEYALWQEELAPMSEHAHESSKRLKTAAMNKEAIMPHEVHQALAQVPHQAHGTHHAQGIPHTHGIAQAVISIVYATHLPNTYPSLRLTRAVISILLIYPIHTLSMSSQKIIAVLGATGNQGGSVAKAFSSEPGWTVRALTRNTTSARAKALSSQGAQVVHVDMDEPSTLGSAFRGVHAIFAVSDFWALYTPENKHRARPGQALNVWAAEHEEQQLKNVVDAAANVPTLERFVISSLSHASKWSKGKYTRVYHFDGKARAAEYAEKAHPHLWSKTSIFQPGIFLSNFVSLPPNVPVKRADGLVQFSLPLESNIKFPYIAADEDSGPLVKSLITKEPAGRNLIAYREWISPREIGAAFTRATGLKAEVTFTRDAYPPNFPQELKAELQDCFDYFNEFGYEARDDPTIVHPQELNSPPSLSTVQDFFKKQDWSKVLG
ncbi:hypothetical protein F66182_6615 [Fusarium sp. NRRL 66182]|nr:hypothetical protein F66182_6615 [Fusarium sp. NRRL 66182]